MPIQYNAQPSDPTLLDLIDQIKRDVFLKLNCHAHATVQSFNSSNQTITATINYLKTVFVSSQPGQEPTPQTVKYPALINCPVFFPQDGAGGSLTFPIQPGAQALIAFNDRDMDNYLASAVVTQNNSGRAHSFSDAFAFVGVNPFPKALSNFDTVRALLQKANAKVGCGPSGVLISNNGTKLSTLLENLITQLEDLCTQLETLTVLGVTAGGGTSGVPSNAAAIAAISTNLSTISTQIGQVLE